MIQNLSSSLSLTNSISGRESTLGATQEEEEEEGTLRGSLAFLKCRFLNEFERKLFGPLAETWRSKTNKFVNREEKGRERLQRTAHSREEEEEGTLRGSRVLPERRPLTNTFCVLGFRSLQRVKQ